MVCALMDRELQEIGEEVLGLANGSQGEKWPNGLLLLIKGTSRWKKCKDLLGKVSLKTEQLCSGS